MEQDDDDDYNELYGDVFDEEEALLQAQRLTNNPAVYNNTASFPVDLNTNSNNDEVNLRGASDLGNTDMNPASGADSVLNEKVHQELKKFERKLDSFSEELPGNGYGVVPQNAQNFLDGNDGSLDIVEEERENNPNLVEDESGSGDSDDFDIILNPSSARMGTNMEGILPQNKYVRPGAEPLPQSAPQPFPGQVGQHYPRAGGLDFSLPSDKTIFDVDIDAFGEKPWQCPGIDMSDYFNFGLNESRWKDYRRQVTTGGRSIPVFISHNDREGPSNTPYSEVHNVDWIIKVDCSAFGQDDDDVAGPSPEVFVQDQSDGNINVPHDSRSPVITAGDNKREEKVVGEKHDKIRESLRAGKECQQPINLMEGDEVSRKSNLNGPKDRMDDRQKNKEKSESENHRERCRSRERDGLRRDSHRERDERHMLKSKKEERDKERREKEWNSSSRREAYKGSSSKEHHQKNKHEKRDSVETESHARSSREEYTYRGSSSKKYHPKDENRERERAENGSRTRSSHEFRYRGSSSKEHYPKDAHKKRDQVESEGRARSSHVGKRPRSGRPDNLNEELKDTDKDSKRNLDEQTSRKVNSRGRAERESEVHVNHKSSRKHEREASSDDEPKITSKEHYPKDAHKKRDQVESEGRARSSHVEKRPRSGRPDNLNEELKDTDKDSKRNLDEQTSRKVNSRGRAERESEVHVNHKSSRKHEREASSDDEPKITSKEHYPKDAHKKRDQVESEGRARSSHVEKRPRSGRPDNLTEELKDTDKDSKRNLDEQTSRKVNSRGRTERESEVHVNRKSSRKHEREASSDDEPKISKRRRR